MIKESKKINDIINSMKDDFINDKTFGFFYSDGRIEKINYLINTDSFLYYTDNKNKKETLKELKEFINLIKENLIKEKFIDVDPTEKRMLLDIKDRIEDIINIDTNIYHHLKSNRGVNNLNTIVLLNTNIKDFQSLFNKESILKTINNLMSKLVDNFDIKECQNNNIDLSLYFLKKAIFNSKHIEPLQDIRNELKNIKQELKNIDNDEKQFNDR